MIRGLQQVFWFPNLIQWLPQLDQTKIRILCCGPGMWCQVVHELHGLDCKYHKNTKREFLLQKYLSISLHMIKSYEINYLKPLKNLVYNISYQLEQSKSSCYRTAPLYSLTTISISFSGSSVLLCIYEFKVFRFHMWDDVIFSFHDWFILLGMKSRLFQIL